MTNLIFNKKYQKNTRQELRKNIPVTEKILWKKLCNKQLSVRFRRQYGVGRYVTDFYSPEAKLVIELDGDSHFNESSQEYDFIRNQYMHALGLKVLRFTNNEVLSNIDEVVEEIRRNLTPP